MQIDLTALSAVLLIIAFIAAGCLAVAPLTIPTTLHPVGAAWSKSDVNATIFRNDPITTTGDQQFVSYYDPNGKVIIGQRRIGSRDWKVTVTPFTGNAADAHNGISMIADGDGYLHLSWDHHANTLRYARSESPASLDFKQMPMTGQTEANVTYPQFFPLPNGNLMFMYRNGGSGRGNLVINSYDRKLKKWTQIYSDLISGQDQRNAYWQACIDRKGSIHVSWVWRESSNVSSNHDLCYARSDDGGHTWLKSDGMAYALPITSATAEIALAIPQKQELINQTSMCVDANCHPIIATYFRPVNAITVQYFVVRFDGQTWRTIQVSDRKTTFHLDGGGAKQIPISRPQILTREVNGTTQLNLIFRDVERDSRISIAVCNDLNAIKWDTYDLTDLNVHFWEPSYDHIRWQRDGVLDLYVQAAGQGDVGPLGEDHSQIGQILEWIPEK